MTKTINDECGKCGLTKPESHFPQVSAGEGYSFYYLDASDMQGYFVVVRILNETGNYTKHYDWGAKHGFILPGGLFHSMSKSIFEKHYLCIEESDTDPKTKINEWLYNIRKKETARKI